MRIRNSDPRRKPEQAGDSGNVGEGLAVLWKNTAFRVFLIANTLAFGLSTTSVFVHFLGSSAITGNVFHGEVVYRVASFTNLSVVALHVLFCVYQSGILLRKSIKRRNLNQC